MPIPATSASISGGKAAIGITGQAGQFIEGKTGSTSTGINYYQHADFPAKGTVYTFTPKSSAISTSEFDPLFSYQWHIYNYGQFNGTSGIDANIIPVWTSGNKGEGIRLAVVDSGMDINHEDLIDNVVSGASYNYLTSGTDPSADNANHGTAIGGIISARDFNGKGIRGVAPRSSIFAYNLLQSPTSTNIGDAMTRGTFDISNNSWGAPDNRGLFNDSFADSIWKAAIQSGINDQRSNKGAIYIWAIGNGGSTVDNGNYDGQGNYYGVMAVGALGDDGKKASYSENGANLLIVAPSQGNSDVAITTIDNSASNGYNSSSSSTSLNYSDINYTNTFNGTSAAAPVVAGVVALILKGNSSLTWRDIRLILAETARQVDTSDSGWFTGAAKISTGNYKFNHKYGFGLVDASAAVNLAKNWSSVGGSTSMLTSANFSTSPSSTIPDNNSTGISSTITVSSGAGVGMSKIEFVEINLSSNHSYVGDLDIRLTSPAGTTSILAEKHLCYDASQSQINCSTLPSNTWRFGSVAHLGETPTGDWKLTIKDLSNNDTGTFSSWNIKFYGR